MKLIPLSKYETYDYKGDVAHTVAFAWDIYSRRYFIFLDTTTIAASYKSKAKAEEAFFATCRNLSLR